MVDRAEQGLELLEGPWTWGVGGRARGGRTQAGLPGARPAAGGAGRAERADARQRADGGDLQADRWSLGAMGHAARDFIWALLGLWLLLCSWSCLGSAELRAPPDKIGRREGGSTERGAGARPAPGAVCVVHQAPQPRRRSGRAGRTGKSAGCELP